MRVAWVSDRDILDGQGGAEAADRDMLDARPDDVTIELVGPGGITVDGYLDDFDAIVVTGFYYFASHELNELARHDYSLWAHDVQMSGHWLYEKAQVVTCLTTDHRDYEINKNPLLKSQNVDLNPGTLANMDECYPVDKEEFAFWAHRNVQHKGEDLAHLWAQSHKVNLEVWYDRPRIEVIARMRQARYFILLSHIFDPGPRSVMEAQLCECALVVNSQVGYWALPPEELRILLKMSPINFWERALNV